MIYTEIGENFLVEASIPATAKKRGPVGHIWILDVSGSMTYFLPELAENVILHSKNLLPGDTISIGWFSSEGMYRFFIKNLLVGGAALGVIEHAVRKECRARALTCFSEILEDASLVVDEMSPQASTFSLMFFTDGYPVVSDYDTELGKISAALLALNKKVHNAMFVGYGNYYNKKLLAEMSKTMGGLLVHSSALDEFSRPMGKFIENFGVTYVERTVPELPAFAFAIYNGTIITLKVHGSRIYAPEDCEKIYCVLSQHPWGQRVPAARFPEEAFYAAALIFTKNLQTDRAIEIMTMIGDVHFVRLLNNSWTNLEYGRAESQLQNAAIDKELRFEDGKISAGNMPTNHDISVFSVLELLSDDKDAYFYPFHGDFEYTRIGQRSFQEEGYPVFSYTDAPRCKFSDLVWNEKRLNLSIRAKIPGTIELDEYHAQFGFAGKAYNTYVWRNYTIIRDGFHNVRYLPVSVGDIAHVFLGDVLQPTDEKGIFLIDLWDLPLVTRHEVEAVQAYSLCYAHLKRLKVKAYLKVLKYYRNKLDPDRKIKSDLLDDEQIGYLMDLGVTRNGYSPPVVKDKPTDKYDIKEFVIKAAGLSSLPSVVSVLKKMEDPRRALTRSAELVANGIVYYRGLPDQSLPALEQEIASLKQLAALDSYDIARAKFAVLVAKQWFSDLTTRENCVIMVDGVECKLDIKDAEVLL